MKPHNYFLITNKCYYFHVKDNIDITKLYDCKFFNSLEDLYTNVMKVCELDFDEVDGFELVIENGKCFDDRSVVKINGSIEDYLNEFEM